MALTAELRERLIQQLKLKKISYSTTEGWGNYQGTVENPESIALSVKSDEEVQMVMQIISTLNKDRTQGDKITVRAAAGWEDSYKGNNCCFWPQAQENHYDESFSFSQVVGGRSYPNSPGTDVVIRFAKSYHKMKVVGPLENQTIFNPDTPIHQLPSVAVEVSAGVQIAKLADYLRKHHLSLPTVSMIAWVTAVGLAGTGGHGTGRDEPGFSGLIQSLKICDMDGNIREIDSSHPDFATLCGAHSGLLGVVLSMKLRAVEAFNLQETIELYPNVKAMGTTLGPLLQNNQYVSIMGMPTCHVGALDHLIPKWQIRKWNYTKEKPTQHVDASYHADMTSITQEMEVRVGASIMEYLLEPSLQHLLPFYTTLAAVMVAESRGTESIVDFENKITHPQVAFPKAMRDVSYQIPVKDAEVGPILTAILHKIEELLNEAGTKNQDPLTYALYVRYIKGSNGGLSTTFTNSDDERIIALDMVTHPNASGIADFEQAFVKFLTNEMNLQFRCHLGKNFPEGIDQYDEFLGKDNVREYYKALERWYADSNGENGAERLAMSPFFTQYLQRMLSPSPDLKKKLELPSEAKPSKGRTDSECSKFVLDMTSAVMKMPMKSDIGQEARKAFVEACLEHLNSKRTNALVV